MDAEIDIADNFSTSSRDFSREIPGARKDLAEYLVALSMDDAMAIILNDRPNDFYDELIILQCVEFTACNGTMIASQKGGPYESEYLHRILFEHHDIVRRLWSTINTIIELRESMKKALNQHLLTDELLISLRNKFDCFAGCWSAVCGTICDEQGTPYKNSLVDPESEQWWSVPKPW